MSRARTLARRLAAQGLYQWQVSGENLAEIHRQFLSEYDVSDADTEYFRELLVEVPKNLDDLDQVIGPLLDRPLDQVDPVEKAVLRIGAYELRFHVEIPYRVIVNESVELAKRFGASESHKFVNGILDQMARHFRKTETSGKQSPSHRKEYKQANRPVKVVVRKRKPESSGE